MRSNTRRRTIVGFAQLVVQAGPQGKRKAGSGTARDTRMPSVAEWFAQSPQSDFVFSPKLHMCEHCVHGNKLVNSTRMSARGCVKQLEGTWWTWVGRKPKKLVTFGAESALISYQEDRGNARWKNF